MEYELKGNKLHLYPQTFEDAFRLGRLTSYSGEYQVGFVTTDDHPRDITAVMIDMDDWLRQQAGEGSKSNR